MIRICRLIWIFLLISCASDQRSVLLFKEIPGVVIKEIPLDNPTEAKKVINNHINFLKHLFTQSTDPYFGIPKWSKECLVENQIGEISEIDRSLQSTSTLYMDSNLAPGLCSSTVNAMKSHLIYLHCENEKVVYEVKYWVPKEPWILKSNLCLHLK